MARVFLSHSSRDKTAAAELKAWLDGQGFAPAFLDFDKSSGIPAGANWERSLYEQIQRCQALLILQTPNWSASRWCFAEFVQARALGKPIFQVVESDEGAAEKPIAADLQRLDLCHDRPAGLEQLRRELERIALQDQGGFPWPPPTDPSRPPFPGLMVFEAEDTPVFFGRDDDWRAVNERLNTRRVQGGPRLLVLQGASGSGKSSLLRAGVLPRLRRAGLQWLVLPVLRPQARPLESLAQTLAVALQRPEAWRELHQQLLTTTEAPALAGLFAGWTADLRLAAGSTEAQLLLPIDQAEELFTVAEAFERERFVAVLAAALQPPMPLQAVMTIRADSMGSLQSLPGLVNSLETLPLGPLSLERYREIIKGPARVAGLTVEETFVERAIHDTATEDALPLLAFALRQLHDRYGADGVLSLSDYEALGDPAAGLSPLDNAVKQAADGVLQAQRPDEGSLKALRESFVPAMVRVSEQGSYARRAASWESLPEAARPLLEALVSARLLVRRQGEGQPSTVEVAHEALLRVWPLLCGWLNESRDYMLESQFLEQKLARWEAASPADKPRALLNDLDLVKGRVLLRQRGDQLRPELRAFIQASHQHVTRQNNVKWFSVLAAASLVVVTAGQAIKQNENAGRSQAAQFLARSVALLESDPFASVVNSLAAVSFGDEIMQQPSLVVKGGLLGARDDPASRKSSPEYVLRTAAINNYAISAPIQLSKSTNELSDDEIIDLAGLSSGGAIISSKYGILYGWKPDTGITLLANASQGHIKVVIELHNGHILTAGSDGTLRAWSFQERNLIPYARAKAPQGSIVTSILELPKGILITGGSDGKIRVWSFLNGHFTLLNQSTCALTHPCETEQGMNAVDRNSIIGLVNLSNGEIGSLSSGGDVRRWRALLTDRVSIVPSSKFDSSDYSPMANPNNFISYGKGIIAYATNGGSVYISCMQGDKRFSKANTKVTLDLSETSLGDTISCQRVSPVITINAALNDKNGLGRPEADDIFSSMPPLVSSLLWDGRHTLVSGDQGEDSEGNQPQLRLWKNRIQSRRMTSSHEDVQKLILIKKEEIISMGPNDSLSRSYNAYGSSVNIRRWRSPHAQEELANKILSASNLNQILGIACHSLDLDSIVKDDQLSGAAHAAMKTCRKLRI